MPRGAYEGKAAGAERARRQPGWATDVMRRKERREGSGGWEVSLSLSLDGERRGKHRSPTSDMTNASDFALFLYFLGSLGPSNATSSLCLKIRAEVRSKEKVREDRGAM